MREPLWRVNLHSGFFHGKEAENLNIHKADEKPMEIHTKKKMEIHAHVTGRTSAREKVKQGEAKEGKAEKEKTGTGKKGILRRYREEYKEAKKSVKQKNSMLKTIRQAGTDVALNQLILRKRL